MEIAQVSGSMGLVEQSDAGAKTSSAQERPGSGEPGADDHVFMNAVQREPRRRLERSRKGPKGCFSSMEAI
jgi:hypothetical protein